MNKIILISSESFNQYANRLIPECSFVHFLTFDQFFKKYFIRKFKHAFKLDSRSIVTDFYEIKIDSISMFWIVEQTPQYIASIRNTLILLRWMGCRQPVVVSSFRNLPNLSKLPPYRLPGLFFDYPRSEKFIRLPLHTEEFKDVLSELAPIDISVNGIRYVKANFSLLDHDLCKYPYSKNIT